MTFDEYYILASNAIDEGNDLSDLYNDAMDTFGKDMLEEYAKAEIFLAAFKASKISDQGEITRSRYHPDMRSFYSNLDKLKKIFGDNCDILNDETKLYGLPWNEENVYGVRILKILGQEGYLYSHEVNAKEHIKTRLQEVDNNRDVERILSNLRTKVRNLQCTYVESRISFAALRASGVLPSTKYGRKINKTIDINQYKDIIRNELTQKFGNNFTALNKEIELLNGMCDLEVKLHALDKVSSECKSSQYELRDEREHFVISSFEDLGIGDSRDLYMYTRNAKPMHNNLSIIVKSEMYLAALNASGVMDNLGEKILHPDTIKERYMNSLMDLNISEYNKIEMMSPNEVAQLVFKILKEGPEYLILEGLNKQGFISDDSNDFINAQKDYMESKLEHKDKNIPDNNSDVSSRLYTYMDQAERNYKTLILPAIYRKVAIGSTLAGALIILAPLFVMLIGNILPALAAASSFFAASIPIFSAVGISITLMGTFYLADEKNYIESIFYKAITTDRQAPSSGSIIGNNIKVGNFKLDNNISEQIAPNNGVKKS